MRAGGAAGGLPPVLLYHAVCGRGESAGARSGGSIVEPEQFAWQMAELARRGFVNLTLDVVNGEDGRRLFRLTTEQRVHRRLQLLREFAA